MGKLYLIGTPIGNLEDITLRAVKVLRSVSYALTERRTTTLKLWNKYKINTPLIVYREDNHDRIVSKIVDDIKQGKEIAIVSEAGMPGISDPGKKLVQAIYKEFNSLNIINVIPGPSAVVVAYLSFPILDQDFRFIGFFPRNIKQSMFFDDPFIKDWTKNKYTIIAFESPHRLLKTLKVLQDLESYYTKILNKEVMFTLGVAKELTKLYEEKHWGSVKDVYKKLAQGGVKGEYTLVIKPNVLE